jgi:nucleoside-diphosphate kinase
MNTLSIKEAQKFYEIHKDRPFFSELVSFITRGPIVVAVIEKENAVQEFRKLIGSTNPAEAEDGTIRKIYAKSVSENAIHGSDSDENAILESKFHFENLDFFNEL